jgi:hypothetical protein
VLKLRINQNNLVIGLIITLLFGMFPVCAGAGGTTVSIEDMTVEPGSVISIPIMINNISDFGSATINVAYDPNFFAIEKVAPGDCGSPTYSTEGSTITISSLVADIPGPAGDLVFAEVEAKVLGSEGASQLSIDVETLAHSDGSSISYNFKNGIFTIASDGVSATPTTTQTDTASEEEPVTSLSSEVEDEPTTTIPDATTNVAATATSGATANATKELPSTPTSSEVPGFGGLVLVITMVAAVAISRKRGNGDEKE